MIILNIVSLVIFLYLVVYFLYFLYISYCSSLKKIKEIQDRSYDTEYDYNYNFIIHCQNDEHTVGSLVESLKNQKYYSEKYQINVILDNCTDNTSKVLEIIGGSKIWRLNTEGEPKGKYPSVRWLLERIFATDNSDAYVFLSPEIVLKPDFIEKLNAEINKYPVVSGISLNKSTFPSLISQIISFRKIFNNSIILNGRNIAGFTNYLNEEVFAIKKDAFKELNYCLEDETEPEFEIPLRLLENNILVKHSTNLRAYKQYQDSTENVLKSFNKITVSKFRLLIENFKNLFSPKTSLKHKEFLLNALCPSEFVVLILCVFIVNFTNIEGYILGEKLPYFILYCYISSFAYIIMVSKFTLTKIFLWTNWIIFSPVALIGNFIMNYKVILGMESENKEQEFETDSPGSNSVDVLLTDGEKELNCKLEVLNQDSLYQVVFWFNEKRFPSAKSIKLADAIDEISKKLLDHGFALKICQNCGYFEFNNCGRTSSDSGKCFINVVRKEHNEPENVSITGYCENIIPAHAKEFVKKELENLDS